MKLSNLIARIAMDFGEPAGAVKLKARVLREAGLISSGGRGPGGAEMNAKDVATMIIAEAAMGETLSLPSELDEMSRGRIWTNWTDIGLADRSFAVPDTSNRSLSYKFSESLPPLLEGFPANGSPIAALAAILTFAVTPGSTVEVEHVRCRADAHGRTIEIAFTQMISPNDACAAYVRMSGDPSDRPRFEENDQPSMWLFEVEFTIEAMQRSLKERMTRIPGNAVMQLAQDVLAGGVAHQQEKG